MKYIPGLTALLLCLPFVRAQDCLYGPGCKLSCHCDGPCDPQTGCSPYNCSLGWVGATCQMENVAFNKVAIHSATFMTSVVSQVAPWPVDGNPLTCIGRGPGHSASLTVDLGKVYTVSDFFILRNPGDVEHPDIIRLFVGSSGENFEECDAYVTIVEEPAGMVLDYCNTSRILRGDLLRITSDRETDICEVQIFVCANGTYGDRCEFVCGCCFGGAQCDSTGNCPDAEPRCDSGYEGERCQKECPPGNYGPDCAKECGFCTNTCDRLSGDCPDADPPCKPGYTGRTCDEEAETPDKCNLMRTILIAGVVSGTVVLAAIILAVVVMSRKKKQEVLIKKEQKMTEKSPLRAD